MRRFILTGTFVFALSASAFGQAVAATAAPVTGTPGVVLTEQSILAAAKAADAAAAPTAGADLAMWNVAAVETVTAPKVVIKNAPATAPSLTRFATGIMARSTAIASSLTKSAMRFVGVPYVFGGTSVHGFDCSGYVQHVFAMMGFHLPRTADAQFDAGRRIVEANMVPGDLVFFHTYAPGVSHVGIYLGHDRFIHSSSHGVMVSSLHDSYWAPRYVGAKRVVGS